MRHLAHIFTELTEGLAGGGSLLLLTDYDGTLTPLVADPEEAWLPREVRDDLRLLARSPWVCLGILSGRVIGVVLILQRRIVAGLTAGALGG